MEKKRFIKKCMSIGISRNEARLLSKRIINIHKARERDNAILKRRGTSERRSFLTYDEVYMEVCIYLLKGRS